MDRFIEHLNEYNRMKTMRLKSNMDRFIALLVNADGTPKIV